MRSEARSAHGKEILKNIDREEKGWKKVTHGRRRRGKKGWK